MPCSRSVYPLIHALLQRLVRVPHRTGATALAHLVTALLVSQSLQPTRLARTLLSAPAVSARQRYQRLQRLLGSPWLTSAWLSPWLVRGALCLWPTPQPLLALDTVRCGGWEVFTVGLVLRGRVQVLAWAVLPYPWPPGRFTPTACALLQQVAAAWPADQPRPHLVADRIFPSRALFRTCDRVRFGYTVRLRAPQTVPVAGQARRVRDLLPALCQDGWTSQAASYGQGPGAIAGQLVLGRGLPVLAWHQRDAGSARARRARAAQRAYDRKERHWAAAAQTDAWVVLFSSEPQWLTAVRHYRGRYATEGTYRDFQRGADGRQGWDLEAVAAGCPTAAAVAALVALAALAQCVQQGVGSQVGAADSGVGQHLATRWSVHGRLSLFARGRLAFTDTTGDLADWLGACLRQLADHLAQAPLLLVPRPPPRQPHTVAAPKAA